MNAGRSKLKLARIGCISTSRADAGIYQPLLHKLSRENYDVSLLAGGTHLEQGFGRTIDHIAVPDGVHVSRVSHFVPGDSVDAVTRSCGLAIPAFAQAIAAQCLDLVFVLGDRLEMLAATMAATICRLPIAHLHGGDVTEGVYDDACRHAITKLAYIHFPALNEHAARIQMMSEESWRIHRVGALAVDKLMQFKPLSLAALRDATGCEFSKPTYVVAIHPETLSSLSPEAQINQLLAALEKIDDQFLILGCNADLGHNAFSSALQSFVTKNTRAKLIPSLTQDVFWSCLTHAIALIGNSSAAILEAPSLKLPAINIGDRQKGRVRAKNVIDAPFDCDAILSAVKTASSHDFRQSLSGVTNPYGDGRAAERIAVALRDLPDRNTLMHKKSEHQAPA